MKERKELKDNCERRELTADGRIYIPYEKSSIPLLRGLTGARFVDSSPLYWQVSLAEADRFRLLEVADQLKLKVAPELRSVRISPQATAAASPSLGLHPFQVVGVDWLANGPKRFLADEMGCGKTIMALMSFAPNDRVLAIVPANVKYNWVDEAKKWRPEFKVTILEGRRSFRLPMKGEIVITNYDILPEYLEPVKAHPYAKAWHVKVEWPTNQMAEIASECTVVVDECQKVKNYTAKRAKRVKGLAMTCRKVIGLSGTPLENRPEDLFGTLESLQMQHLVFSGWQRFVRLMNGSKGKGQWRYVWGTPKPEVPELLRRVMLRRTRQEVLPDLPSVVYTIVKVDIKSKKLVSDLDKLWNKYGDFLDDNQPLERCQLPPFEEFSTIRAKLAESRIEVLDEMVEEAEEDEIPLVVFSAHLAPLNYLAEREGWEKITGDTPSKRRQEIVRDFQAGRLKGLALSIRAASVGINATYAWKMIFIDQDWVPAQNWQAIARLCRIGQLSNKIEVVLMVSNHPLDLRVLELISWKTSIIDKAIDSSFGVKDDSSNRGE